MVEMLIMGTCRVSCTVFLLSSVVVLELETLGVAVGARAGQEGEQKIRAKKKKPWRECYRDHKCDQCVPVSDGGRGGCLRGTHSGRDNANVVEDNKIPSRMGLDSCATMAGGGTTPPLPPPGQRRKWQTRSKLD